MSNFHRKPNRLLLSELYQKGQWYFVTICVQDRKCIFTSVAETPSSPLRLNSTGKIIQKEWLKIPQIYRNTIIDEYVIMPNHFHGIVGFIGESNTNLSNIISAFKSISYKKIKQLLQNGDGGVSATIENGKQGLSATIDLIKKHNTIWQKSFYDRIIRNEKELTKLQEYIYNNPLQWELDELNPNNNKDI